MTGAAAALLLAALLPAGPSSGAPAPSPPGRALIPRGRWHFEAPGPPAVRWSNLFRRTDEWDESRLLIETPAGRYVLVSTQPATGLDTREEVAIPSLRESVSRTLAYADLEAVKECARIRPPDACVVLTGSRGRLASPLSAFSGESSAALKRQAVGLVSPVFLARLAGLAPALRIVDLAFYSDDFLAFLDPALARPKGSNLNAPRLPGCEFDAAFGYPCTADERRREEWLFRRAPAPKPR